MTPAELQKLIQPGVQVQLHWDYIKYSPYPNQPDAGKFYSVNKTELDMFCLDEVMGWHIVSPIVIRQIKGYWSND